MNQRQTQIMHSVLHLAGATVAIQRTLTKLVDSLPDTSEKQAAIESLSAGSDEISEALAKLKLAFQANE